MDMATIIWDWHPLTHFKMCLKKSINWFFCKEVYFQNNQKSIHDIACVMCMLAQGTLNNGSVSWQMSARFSCFKSAIEIMKKYLVLIETTYSRRYSIVACNSQYAYYSLVYSSTFIQSLSLVQVILSFLICPSLVWNHMNEWK